VGNAYFPSIIRLFLVYSLQLFSDKLNLLCFCLENGLLFSVLVSVLCFFEFFQRRFTIVQDSPSSQLCTVQRGNITLISTPI